uniref:Uncharacterized protein n=1 Tax=Peronospora matthiolae TaxID=2874970 RepID=A0AAV1TXS6_9STRA
MDFVFGFPKDVHKINGILAFVDRFSKMVHLVAVPESITAQGCARVFIDAIFRLHGLCRELVSDRDYRFAADFCQSVFRSLRTRLTMSTSDHPETYGQTERFNRVLEEILRGYVHSFKSWSEFLPMAEFAINNLVHASTTHTPFFVNGLRHPRLPAFLECDYSFRVGDSLEQNRSGSCSSPVDNGVDVMDADVDGIDVDDDDDDNAGIFSITNDRQSEDDDTLTGEDSVLSAVHTKSTTVDKDESAEEFLLTRKAVVRFVQDSIADALDRQKKNADKHGRANFLSFDIGDLVLLSTVNLPKRTVTNVCSSKLLPRYIGPFRVLRRMSNAYTIELPLKMRTHPTFYVGRLRPYYQYEPVSRCEEHLHGREPRPPSSGPVSTRQSGRLAKLPVHASQRCLDEQQPAHHEENESNVRSQAARTQKRRDRPNDPRSSCNFSVTLEAPEHQADPTLESDQVFSPPPHPLVGSVGGQRFLVERILNHRDVNGVRTSYLVRWRGYPPAWDSWEPRVQLIVDVLGFVEQYDETHPLRSKKGRRKKNS